MTQPHQIIVDSREARSDMSRLLREQGLTVTVQELEVGDYVLAEGVAVERKTATDFLLSIMDKRLFCQAPLLKQTYARPFIIIEGDVFATRSAMEPAAINGAISYLTVLEGIPVTTTRDTAHTAQMLATMHRHATEGLGYQIALRGAKPKTRDLQAQYAIEGLPGIGPNAAKKLLECLGSPAAIFAADAARLRGVPGIGPKTAEAIVEVANWQMRSSR